MSFCSRFTMAVQKARHYQSGIEGESMRNLFVLLTIMSAAFQSKEGYAQETQVKDWTVSTQVGYYQRYWAGTAGTVFFNGPVFQDSTTATHKSGLYLNLWHSYSPKGGLDKDFGDEVDFVIGRSQDIGRNSAVNLDYGYAYYDLSPLTTGKGDFHALYIRLTGNKGLVRPFVSIERDIANTPNVGRGGTLYKGGIITNVQGIALTASLGGHGASFGYPARALNYVQLVATRTFVLNRHISITPQMVTQRRIGGPGLSENRSPTFGLFFSIQ